MGRHRIATQSFTASTYKYGSPGNQIIKPDEWVVLFHYTADGAAIFARSLEIESLPEGESPQEYIVEKETFDTSTREV